MYLESVSLGEHFKHVYMATPLSVLKKVTKNGTFARKNNEAIGQKKNWHKGTS